MVALLCSHLQRSHGELGSGCVHKTSFKFLQIRGGICTGFKQPHDQKSPFVKRPVNNLWKRETKLSKSGLHDELSTYTLVYVINQGASSPVS